MSQWANRWRYITIFKGGGGVVAGSTPEEEVQTILMKKSEMVEKVVRNFLREGGGRWYL